MNLLETLTQSRDLLVRDGWIQKALVNEAGSHCALGAVLAVLGGQKNSEAGMVLTYSEDTLRTTAESVEALWEQLPEDYKTAQSLDDAITKIYFKTHGFNVAKWTDIVDYNNGTFEESVLDMFNNAIAAASEITPATTTSEELVKL